MPPRKQFAHLKEIRSLAHQEKAAHLNAEQFVFSILVEGLNFKSTRRCMLWNNINPPSAHKFYEVQAKIAPILVSLARESCDSWRQSMTPGSIISLDGSWSHRRNAARCILDFIDAGRNKVVDFEIVEKTGCRVEGNYEGPSNGMEREALRRMIPRWLDDTRVVGYCHDNDGKTRKTIAGFGWKITEYLDRNHLMGSFDRTYNKFPKKKLLWGLKEKLRHWMLLLLCEDITLELKKFYWETVTVEHFSGNHENCPLHKGVTRWRYGDDQRHVEALKEFLLQTSHYLDKCGRLISTQMNESLHAIKAHYADKMFCWGHSWTARVCVAILQVNEPETWKLELYRRLRLPPLAPDVEKRLKASFHSQAVENEMRRLPDFRIRENKRRKEKRITNKKNESRCSDYGHPAVRARSEEEEDLAIGGDRVIAGDSANGGDLVIAGDSIAGGDLASVGDPESGDDEDTDEIEDDDEAAVEEACAEVADMTPETFIDDDSELEEPRDWVCSVA